MGLEASVGEGMLLVHVGGERGWDVNGGNMCRAEAVESRGMFSLDRLASSRLVERGKQHSQLDCPR